VSVDISRKSWLAELVDAELRDYDPAVARARLPREIRDPSPEGPDLEGRARMLVSRSLRRSVAGPGGEGVEAFLVPVDGHLGLVLDVALVMGAPFDAARRRAEMAAILAAAAGDISAAVKAAPAAEGGPPGSWPRRALARAGDALLRLHYPPGDPEGGLPLYTGTVAIHRRLLGRIALAYYEAGALDPDHAVAQVEQAQDEMVLLVEALAGLVSAEAPVTRGRRQRMHGQVARLDLDRERGRAARAALGQPRDPEEICAAAPPGLRWFLVEQLLIASLATPASAAAGEYVARLAKAAGISPDELAAMRVEAAAFHADHGAWFRALGLLENPEWAELEGAWNEIGERMVQGVAAAVTRNMEAIVTELRETGELGTLVARAAAGHKLTTSERAKVKEQLIDVAKAVPALAIFAAPGGLVLLPLLAKLLPFNLLPSAFQESGKGPAERKKALPPAGEEPGKAGGRQAGARPLPRSARFPPGIGRSGGPGRLLAHRGSLLAEQPLQGQDRRLQVGGPVEDVARAADRLLDHGRMARLPLPQHRHRPLEELEEVLQLVAAAQRAHLREAPLGERGEVVAHDEDRAGDVVREHQAEQAERGGGDHRDPAHGEEQPVVVGDQDGAEGRVGHGQLQRLPVGEPDPQPGGRGRDEARAGEPEHLLQLEAAVHEVDAAPRPRRRAGGASGSLVHGSPLGWPADCSAPTGP
jgi:hypothetical protein